MAEQNQRISELTAAALKLLPSERRAYVRTASGGDQALYDLVMAEIVKKDGVPLRGGIEFVSRNGVGYIPWEDT
jgi:hypothetical protein